MRIARIRGEAELGSVHAGRRQERLEGAQARMEKTGSAEALARGPAHRARYSVIKGP